MVCLGLAALVLSGCATKRTGYDVPEFSLPAQFKNTVSADAPDATATSSDANDIPAKLKVPQDPGLTEWWRSFGNRELEQLVDRGLANNPDLRMAMLRVAQAKERADQAQAGKLPTVSVPLLAGIQAPGGQAGTVPTSGGISQTQQSYQASIRANWRVDVWGEQSALTESAKFQLWRAVFERDDAQRNMVANLSSAYVEYISLNDRLKVAHENEAVLSEIMISLEKRVSVGDATLSDSAQQKAAIFSLRATIPSLEQQREDLLNTIAFLVGAVPGTLTLSDNGLDSLYPPSAMPGLPSALLLRRPDVRMAEARLLAADADIDVARARLLPPIDLSAQAGLSSILFSQLFMAKSLFWNSIANLSVTIFDGGKKASDKKISQAVHEEMVEGYAKTINQAMREVESALSSVRLTEKRLEAARQATEAARQAWDISTKVYAVGGVEYQTFLDTERTYHRYLDEYQQIRMANSRGYISLFSALGGGVRAAESLPGKGIRPTSAQGGAVGSKSSPGSLAAAGTAPAKSHSSEGVDRAFGTSGDLQVENFWQVELPGLYHRTTIGAAWRDLRTRYPKFMENLFLRPRLSGRIEESEDGQESWYRLYVAKFPSLASADEFCAALKASYQRCRIVSSRSDETVTLDNVGQPAKAAGLASAAETAKTVKDSADDQPATETAPLQKTEPVAVPFALKIDPELNPATLPVTAQNDHDPESEQSPTKGLPSVDLQKLAYTLQLGMFANLENAGILQTLWQAKGYQVYIAESSDAQGRSLYAVRTGLFPQRPAANVMAHAVRRKENAPVVVVPAKFDLSGKPMAVDPSKLRLSGTQVATLLRPELPEAPESFTAKPGSDTAGGQAQHPLVYAVQMGAFPAMKNATVSLSFWKSKGYQPYIAEIKDAEQRTWYAVRTGEFAQRRKATALAKSIGHKVGFPAIVVQSDEPKIPQTVTENSIEKSFSGHEQKVFYSVQLGAFSSLPAAAKSYAAWRDKGGEVYVCEMKNAKGQPLFAVREGKFARRADAASLVKSVAHKHKSKLILVLAEMDDAGNLKKVEVESLM